MYGANAETIWGLVFGSSGNARLFKIVRICCTPGSRIGVLANVVTLGVKVGVSFIVG